MNTPDIWLGTDRSFAEYLAQLSHYQENPERYATREQHWQVKLEGFESPADYLAESISSQHGSTGIVSIEGPMTTSTSIFNLLAGSTGYDAIGQSLLSFANDESVDNILMVMDTPGGSAQGISELSDLVKDIGKYKPITAYASGGALSAGYWLATSANDLKASRTGELGSVGAISTFVSVAKSLEEKGVEVYVSRSGKEKALLNSMEPISDEAKAMLDSKTKYLHGLFIEGVIKNRPSLTMKSQSSWAEGASYFADQAIEVGLLDGPPVDISTVLSKLSQSSSEDRNAMKRKPLFLSESARAALQAGAELTALSEQPVEQETPQVTDEPQGEVEAKAETQTETKEETATGTELKSEVSDTLTAYLQQSLKEKEEKVDLLTREKIKLEDKLESLQNVEQSLKPIAIQACQRMQVALGQSQSSFDGFSTEAIQAEYKTLQTAFNERYPAGKQSISEMEESQAPATNSLTSRLELIHGGQQ